MPQMSPIYWLFMMMYIILMLMLLIMSMYFFFNLKSSMELTYMEINKSLNWLW